MLLLFVHMCSVVNAHDCRDEMVAAVDSAQKCGIVAMQALPTWTPRNFPGYEMKSWHCDAVITKRRDV